MLHWSSALLPLAPLCAGLAAGALPLPPRALASLCRWMGALILALGLAVAGGVFAGGPLRWGVIYVDALSAYMIAIVALVAFAACLYSAGYMHGAFLAGEVSERRLRWYYLWFFSFIASMLTVVLAANLGLLWVAVEATTLATAFLVGLYGTKPALEAAWKYVVICTVGIAIALLGTIITYFAALPVLGGERALLWEALAAVAGRLDPHMMKLAFILVLVGYGTKAGLAPMHTWLPDAHSQAPAPVSALLSGVLISSALYAIIRFYALAAGALGPAFPAALLLVFGLLSLAVAAPFIVLQRDFKRLLAYSSVEHMGIIAAGLGLAGLGGAGKAAALAGFGAVLHLLSHACAKAALFFAAGDLAQAYSTRLIDRVQGAVRVAPVAGTALVAGTFAITGTPPFALFASEFAIVGGAFARGLYLPGVLFLFFLSVIFGGMMYYVTRMAFGRAPARVNGGAHGAVSGGQDLAGVAAIALPLALVLIIGLYLPPPLQRVIGQVAAAAGLGGWR